MDLANKRNRVKQRSCETTVTMTVPTKRDTVDGHGKINLNTGCLACKTDGIDVQDTEGCNSTIITDISGGNEVIRRYVQNDQTWRMAR